jgi:hypothetical protein
MIGLRRAVVGGSNAALNAARSASRRARAVRTSESRETPVYEYEVVPVVITRGAGEAQAGSEWETLRQGLNEHGRMGFRVVAVSNGVEGRAVIMEREVGDGRGGEARGAVTAASQSVSEAAEEITRESARDA